MGAGDGDAQKRLRHVLRGVQRIAVDQPIIGRAVLHRVAGGGYDLVANLSHGLSLATLSRIQL